MRQTSIHIPKPCHEKWDAMTPTATGRHCAACKKTVVDFTQKTDAEILAYFRQMDGRETCGRLSSDQLSRPLLPALQSRPAARWRTWLALAVAAWGLRAGPTAATGTPTAGPRTTAHPHKKANPKHRPAMPALKLLHGTVRDSATHEPLPGVAIFLKGENRSTMTDEAGNFSLPLPAQRPRTGRALVLHYAGYQSETVHIAAASSTPMQLALQADPAADGATIVGYGIQTRQDITGGTIAIRIEDPAPTPWPWHPHSFWRWLTQPFRH